MAPDFIVGNNLDAWPTADSAQEYNRRHVNSNSTGGEWLSFAPGCCLHLNIPDTCWIIDPEERPFVDIIVDIAPQGSSTIERKSVIMVRSILDASLNSRYSHLDQHDVVGSLEAIVEHNSLLRRQVPVGTARQNKGDVGSMHAIGTRVLLDGLGTVGYAANYNKVPQTLLKSFIAAFVLKSFIVAFATIGMCCFPDVLSVVQHMEADSSLPPVDPMGGVAMDSGWATR